MSADLKTRESSQKVQLTSTLWKQVTFPLLKLPMTSQGRPKPVPEPDVRTYNEVWLIGNHQGLSLILD